MQHSVRKGRKTLTNDCDSDIEFRASQAVVVVHHAACKRRRLQNNDEMTLQVDEVVIGRDL